MNEHAIPNFILRFLAGPILTIIIRLQRYLSIITEYSSSIAQGSLTIPQIPPNICQNRNKIILTFITLAKSRKCVLHLPEIEKRKI